MSAVKATDSESEALAVQIFQRQCLSALIQRGDIDPTGKSDAELHDDFNRWILRLPPDITFLFTVDHRAKLLHLARRFREKDESYIACLLFATWTEPWINGVIATQCHRNGVSEKDKASLIRSVQRAGKLSWFPAILKMPKLNDAHVKRMTAVAEFRNGFVHYKWKGLDEADEANQDDQARCLTREYESTVKYLHAYESRVISRSRKCSSRKSSRNR